MNPSEKTETLKAIAAFVPQFEYSEPADGRGAFLAGPDAMAIHVNTARQRGKLHIFGSWPMRGQEHMSPRSWGAVPYNEDADPSNNVSVARGPEAIAREISRRFLPAISRPVCEVLGETT